MAHKLESANISFGLVTIPVGIYSAIEEQDIHFNQLHEPCKAASWKGDGYLVAHRLTSEKRYPI